MIGKTLGLSTLSVVVFIGSLAIVNGLVDWLFGPPQPDCKLSDIYSIRLVLICIWGLVSVGAMFHGNFHEQLPLALNDKKEVRDLFAEIFAAYILVCFFSAHVLIVTGLQDSDGAVVIGYWNHVYFAVMNFTTVGFGDFTPCPASRIFSSIIAIAGFFSVPIIIGALLYRSAVPGLPKEEPEKVEKDADIGISKNE